MNNYVGKNCPYCKTEITTTDNIVICSDCDMPHHMDCWVENQGCTTFGCSGTIKAPDNSATSVTNKEISIDINNSEPSGYKFCTKCGTKHLRTASFCSKCGAKLVTSSSQNNTSTNNNAFSNRASTQSAPFGSNGYNGGFAASSGTNYQSAGWQNPSGTYTQASQTAAPGAGYSNVQGSPSAVDPIVLQLVGTNVDYYAPKFQAMKSKNQKVSWNLAAFLLTPFWLMYRKMYVYGAIYLAANFFITLLNFPFLNVLFWIAYFAFGIFGNYAYMTFLEKKAEQAKTMSPYSIGEFITKNSGTNLAVSILSVIGATILTMIIAL